MQKKITKPIINCLKRHVQANPVSFHTPGHKNGSFIPSQMPKQAQELWQYDLTEIAGLDNLHDPDGCIKEAQEQAAKLFKARKSHFLVNGSSLGIHSAIMALAHDEYIFVPRHVHKSIYNGIILANASPIYLPVTYDEQIGVPLGIEVEVLEKYILDYPNCKVLILPNPNYQGISYKIKEIILLAKKSGIKVIIDEAHGAHFSFHPTLPSSALELGADIVIQSWHKTLPVLTQASVVHEGLDYDGPDLSLFINMLQTSSPSYLFLASLDSCRALLAEEGEKISNESYHKIVGFKEEVKKLKTFRINFEKEEFQDFLKFNLSSEVFTGLELDRILRREFALFSELSEENYILFIFSLKVEESDLAKLLDALSQIDKRAQEPNFKEQTTKDQNITEQAIRNSDVKGQLIQEQAVEDKDIKNPAVKASTPLKSTYNIIPRQGLSPRDAFYREKIKVPLDQAKNRICGEFILKFPPGIPLVAPGEIIDTKILEILKSDRGFKDKKEIILVKNKSN